MAPTRAGDEQRFSSEKEALEIHSSAATVLFSYGLVDAVLFLVFAFRVVAGVHLRATAILVPTFAYTIAHQGLRFTMLWGVAGGVRGMQAQHASSAARLHSMTARSSVCKPCFAS